MKVMMMMNQRNNKVNRTEIKCQQYQNQSNVIKCNNIVKHKKKQMRSNKKPDMKVIWKNK